jgi:hypothetical protein
VPASVKSHFPAAHSIACALHDWLASETPSPFFQDVDNRVSLMNIFHQAYPDLWAEHASTPGRAGALHGAVVNEIHFCALHVIDVYDRFYADQTNLTPTAVPSSSKRPAKRACSSSGPVLAAPGGGRGRQ